MARKPAADKSQVSFAEISAQLRTAPCVPALREAVKAWRAGKYKGVTETTRLLLNYWFATDHRLPNGQQFRYHEAQREAIETLIFVWEYEKVRTRLDLLKRYAMKSKDLRLPPLEDEFARYCVKMATGSGKTRVMALAIAWQYLNAVRETGPHADDYASTFLVLAPNVIVLDRLKLDFAGGRVFKTAIVPKEMEAFWDFDCVVRGEGERAHCSGTLFLTNIQQFYERPVRGQADEPEAMRAVLGSPPPTKKLELTDFADRIGLRGGRLLVLTDEGHHFHDEESQGNAVIRRLHRDRMALAAQLDFSATPRFTGGQLFPWTISDYPLKQAIIDGVVKRPYKGVAHIKEAQSEHASVRYQGYLQAAVERWQEYRDSLATLGKKPVLFVMLTSTDEADDVGDWLRTKYKSDFGGEKTLVIHTELRGENVGEVKASELEVARRAAREVDEGTSPVNAIVSVLMLREGWDVQNVTVVVGLRPYTAKANILPEQAIGRGLRLMFRNQSDYKNERVDIIGNDKFLEFVDDLDKLEDLGKELGQFELGKEKLVIVTIQPMDERAQFDIGIPELTPMLSRKRSIAEEIAELDVTALQAPVIALGDEQVPEETFTYEGYDVITLKKEFERQYKLTPPQTAQEIIGFYSRRIAENVKLPAQFAVIAPKVRDFFETRAFGRQADLDETQVVRAMGTWEACTICVGVFTKALKALTIEEQEADLLTPQRLLSQVSPFPWSGPVHEARNTIFNLAACDNQFEVEFAKFLDRNVPRFAKLTRSMGISIDYTDSAVNLRMYHPDWVAVDEEGNNWLIETKGREDVDVAYKDEAAHRWCKSATELTGTPWRYMKVLQEQYEYHKPKTFGNLRSMAEGLTGMFEE